MAACAAGNSESYRYYCSLIFSGIVLYCGGGLFVAGTAPLLHGVQSLGTRR